MTGIIGRFYNLKAATRLIICLGIAVIVCSLAFFYGIGILTGVLLGWDSFCLLMILLSWATFFTVKQQELVHKAREEDESRYITLILVLGSVCISLVGILLLMRNTDSTLVSKGLHRIVSLLGVALSWGLLHTILTLHYAHLYYSDVPTGPKDNVGGLDFPSDDKPDYLDFAYFSFVVGMTFQVSDVQITSKLIRRVALMHGFISFVFNTAIVALTISIISNLGK